ncbi:uncharacterized protein LOC125042002 [Penaeus chinensis]|uniref:uncharacterized protein LOC125042002 n=1 Tax=Penaeus chinensis TaxID=139456 RepID=UPI001FB5D869|nr:uncharacterized protein LOC125042002 [Penaeus chinensis]
MAPLASGVATTSPAAVIGVLLALAAVAASHSLGIGRCKKVDSVPDFQPDQFQGLWHVMEIFSTSSHCMTMTFKRTGRYTFKVTESREFDLLRRLGHDHTFANTGTFTVKHPWQPAKFRARWPSNIFGSADATIVDTDYDSFAVLVECQHVLFFFRRTSAVILSREDSLDPAIVSRVKADLAKYDLDVSHFDVINHSDCRAPSEAAFSYAIDASTVSFLRRQHKSSKGKPKNSPRARPPVRFGVRVPRLRIG